MSNNEKLILIVQNSDLKFFFKNFLWKTISIDELASVLKSSKKYIYSVLFDFINFNEKYLDIIYTIKSKNLYIDNLIPFIGLISKKTDRNIIKKILFHGVDRVIFYPFKNQHLKKIISEIYKNYKDIFIEIPTKNFISFKITDELKYLHIINNYVSRLLYYSKLPPEDIFNLKFALYEIGSNAIKHKGNTGKHISISISFFKDKLIYKIKDYGKGFEKKILNRFLNGDTLSRLNNIENAGGLGIFLTNKIMDKIIYNKKGNYVILEKNLLRSPV